MGMDREAEIYVRHHTEMCDMCMIVLNHSLFVCYKKAFSGNAFWAVGKHRDFSCSQKE